MKKSSVLMIAAALLLSSCGTLTKLISSGDGQEFQDNIYGSKPEFIAKEDKEKSKAETEDLIAKTKESPIYLFGDKKDSIMIPDDYAATIRYDRQLGSTVVTVGANPYDWRNNINPWSYYTPYSIGSSWYWSRHWDPFWSMSPLGYGWHDPWYYGGYWGRWYDPWYYSSFWGWDPWYYSGYWNGWYGYPYYYAGWYGGFGPHWGIHRPHFGPGFPGGGHISSNISYTPRFETQQRTVQTLNEGSDRMVARRGFGESSSTGRGTISSSTSRNTVNTSKPASASRNEAAAGKTESRPATTYRRPAVSNGNSAASSSVTRGSGSSSESRSTVERSSSNYDRNSSGTNVNRTASQTQNRSASYNTNGASNAGRSGGYNRTGAGGGRR